MQLDIYLGMEVISSLIKLMSVEDMSSTCSAICEASSSNG